MNVYEKIKAIKNYYGSTTIKGVKLTDMDEKQVNAIYSSMKGKFDLYEAKKEAYVALFPNNRYEARKRADKMSFFKLSEIIPKVIKDKDGQYPEDYQFTVYDLQEQLEGKELEKLYGNNGKAQEQK